MTMQWPYRIRNAMPREDGHEVVLTWEDGSTSVTDMGPAIGRGGVFAPLADPDFFRRVTVSQNGRAIEWPGGIDCCADALWYEAHPQDNPHRAGQAAAE